MRKPTLYRCRACGWYGTLGDYRQSISHRRLAGCCTAPWLEPQMPHPATRRRRAAGGTLAALVAAAVLLATAPLWIVPAVAWMICTGRTPKSCGLEANAMSQLQEQPK
ncbi:MAG: hypothetical protein M0Q49_01990 [Porticoccaceae bacterium]|nr:hypothetical protein [Porticoccaceae bacterium]